MHVFVIEDSLLDAVILEKIVASVPAVSKASVFTDPAAVLSAVGEGASDVDLLVLDLMMPGMNGLELIETLRSRHGMEPPAIMITASDDPDFKRRALEEGVIDFITKPVNSAELKAKVANLLSLSRRLKEIARDEAALSKKKSFLRSIFDSIDDIIVVRDSAMNVVEVNASGERLRESRSQLSEDCCGALFNLVTACDPCPTRKTLTTGEKSAGTLTYNRDDGSRRWCEVKTYPIFGEDGVVEGAVEYVRDVTAEKTVEESFRNNEDLLRTVLNTLPVGVGVADRTGRIIYINPEGQKIWGGVRYADIDDYDTYRGWWHYTQTRINAREWPLARAILDGESSRDKLVDIEAFDGSRKIVTNSAEPVFDSFGEIIGALFVNMDVTQSKMLEEKFMESKYLYETLVTNSSSCVILTNEHFLYVNPAFEKLTGYTSDELRKMFLWDIVHPSFRKKIRSAVHGRLQGKSQPAVLTEWKIVTKKGEEVWIQGHANTVIYNGEFASLYNFADVSEQKRTEERLRRLATTDYLTGILNRRRFVQVLEAEIDRTIRFGSTFAVIIFDVDHFKEVNDTHGHHAGDTVLTRLTAVVEKRTRKVDSFARWGGEEFILLAPGADLERGMTVADKLRRLLKRDPLLAGFGVTVSLGVAGYRSGDSVESVIRRADSALYRAKNEGRDRVCMED